MPYITEAQRTTLRGNSLVRRIPHTPGELNFCLTEVILEYLDLQGLSYQTLNDITGALGEAKAEFRRRVIAPYENHKIDENGDVYPYFFRRKD